MNNISVVSSIDDVKLVKYEKDNTLLYYGVEVSNNDIGINIKFTKDFNEALKIYNKEAYLDYIQKTMMILFINAKMLPNQYLEKI